MKQGDIILINDRLAEIVDIHYRNVIKQVLVKKNPWYKSNQYKNIEVKKIDQVSWRIIGKTPIVTTPYENYNWKILQKSANYIINQVKTHICSQT